MTTPETKKILRSKAYDIIDQIDIEKLAEGIDNIQLAYILSLVDNVVTIKCQAHLNVRNSKNEIIK